MVWFVSAVLVDLPQYIFDHQKTLVVVDGFDPSSCAPVICKVKVLLLRFVARRAGYVTVNEVAVGLNPVARVPVTNPE
jgi:hypothetical protein